MNAQIETPKLICDSHSDYLANVSWLSRGMLQDFRTRRRLFQRKYILDKVPEEPPSDAMKLGTLCHSVLLEGKSIDDLVAIIPAGALNDDGHRKGGNWTEWKKQQDPAKLLYTAKEYREAAAMVESVLSHPAVGQWHKAAAFREASIYWTEGDVNFRLRADWIIDGIDLLAIDLKTAKDASYSGMQRVIKSQYAFQQAHYTRGIAQRFGRQPTFLFVVVDNQEPFTTYVHSVGDAAARTVAADWEQTVAEVALCLQTNDWSDGEEEIQWHDFTEKEYLTAKGW